MSDHVSAFLARTQRLGKSEGDAFALVRNRFRYEPETGEFFHRIGWRAEQRAGFIASGYWTVSLLNRHIRAHRIAWLYVYGEWPKGLIDHINRDKLDNRIANLRVVDFIGNAANTDVNPTHFKAAGVSRDKRRVKNPWRARIKVGDERRIIGVFPTKEEARAAYLNAAREAFGPEARCELAEGKSEQCSCKVSLVHVAKHELRRFRNVGKVFQRTESA